MVLATALVINKIRNVARASRLRYYMILLGCFFSTLSNVLVLFAVPSYTIDSTLWGVTFALFFFYFAMDTSPTSTYILARNQVFEAIGEYIFVLDTDWIITDINSPAREWLKKQGFESDPATIDILFDTLEDKGATIEMDENLERQELFFLDDENSLFSSFAIKRNYIYDSNKSVVGIIVTLSDMTAIRKTLRGLQAISTIDELTGTYNRRGYERLLSNHDKVDTLPLGIIMGDVNGLKRVNDTMGHAAGDDLLRQAAMILVECIGDYGSVARIGGDEFAIITPNIDEAQLNHLISRIKSTFKDKKEELLGGGIAIGYAIKSKAGQDISSVIERADKNMYEDKRNDRRQSRQ
jgi:diguanylate cyclase (GGDEF)-like protein